MAITDSLDYVDGITEVMGPGYKEDRNFVATLLDPFDIYGMIKGRDKATRFWDEQPKASATNTPETALGSSGEAMRM
jgi:hypothetical protein